MYYVIMILVCLFPEIVMASKKGKLIDYGVLIHNMTYPNPKRTPGEMFYDITERDVCEPGYARKTRNVSTKLKNEVKDDYKIPPVYRNNFMVDHFIPLSLGGTNDKRNLWPQPIIGLKYGANEKAKADTYLFNMVCEGEMSLEEAQARILEDWVLVFQQCCELETEYMSQAYDDALSLSFNKP